MCGILAVLGAADEAGLRAVAIEASKTLRHRGPDWSGYRVLGGNALCHERLAIVDPVSGSQPLTSPGGAVTLCVNGEIYNHGELRLAAECASYAFKTKSDCEVVLPLYEHARDRNADPATWINKLRGMFAFVVHDATTNDFIAVRDHVGICPLYLGHGADGSVWIASEFKALAASCATFAQFPPGHYYSGSKRAFVRWYSPAWLDRALLPTRPAVLEAIRGRFEAAVVRRLMSDVPWGVLLSGGLDSSLVAAIASRHAASRVESAGGEQAWFPRLHSFSVGLADSPDLKAAQKVADFLGTVHHAFVFTIQEGLDALSDVVYHLETYDVTTLRASTPMFLMSRKIKAMGIKMVLSGEGADEVFGGYLYFHKAPSAAALHAETVDKVCDLHKFDCLRANKSTMAWGVEARVPFLDADFLDYAMTIDPSDKMITKGRIEKDVLRRAFDTPERPYLPREVLWRQKEQFSDGVGYGWIDGLKDHADAAVTDAQLAAAPHRFPHNPPHTKEAYLFRSLFDKHFPQQAAAATVPGGPSIACSTAAAVKWSADFAKFGPGGECSGRSVAGVHNDAYSGK